MRRKLIRLLALIAYVVFATSIAGPVAAVGPKVGVTYVGGYSITSCAQAEIDLWENAGYNGHGLAFCYATNSSNLANFSSPTCDGRASWSNCVSSVQYWKGTVTTNACVYDLTNYNQSNPLAWYEQYGSNNEQHQYFIDGDRISSLKWASGCGSPG